MCLKFPLLSARNDTHPVWMTLFTYAMMHTSSTSSLRWKVESFAALDLISTFQYHTDS